MSTTRKSQGKRYEEVPGEDYEDSIPGPSQFDTRYEFDIEEGDATTLTSTHRSKRSSGARSRKLCDSLLSGSGKALRSVGRSLDCSQMGPKGFVCTACGSVLVIAIGIVGLTVYTISGILESNHQSHLKGLTHETQECRPPSEVQQSMLKLGGRFGVTHVCCPASVDMPNQPEASTTWNMTSEMNIAPGGEGGEWLLEGTGRMRTCRSFNEEEWEMFYVATGLNKTIVEGSERPEYQTDP
ncbi:hypothetical protein M231_00868 [Tremella mesenterica]|uniref:Uncharacterized protein n=1 Tax=Tremella mesenterica TaxID=5217 RepID=A0A4Q1BUR3_TREME|nr:hypothetical protein M231_00868 [Tremella mesenterica]